MEGLTPRQCEDIYSSAYDDAAGTVEQNSSTRENTGVESFSQGQLDDSSSSIYDDKVESIEQEHKICKSLNVKKASSVSKRSH
ncbi:hypothetical protein ACO0QE_002066 [Hanseniaspora vineae]